MKELNFDKLTGNGWKQFKDFLGQSDIAFYKTFAGHEECRCNEGKKSKLRYTSTITESIAQLLGLAMRLNALVSCQMAHGLT